MADRNYTAYGQQHPHGMAADRNLPVILGSPHHHYALLRMGAHAAAMDDLLRSVGADAGGLTLTIEAVQRPPGTRTSA